MTSNSSGQLPTAGLADRVKRLLLTPRQEWPAIDAEPMTVAGIFRGWVLLLAAIGPVAGLIGGQLFGHGMFGITFRPGFGTALTTAISTYVLSVAGTFGVALIFNWLSPRFGGISSLVSAVKLAAFSFTAAWLAGIFQLAPGLGWLAILGLYSFYLLYVGGPVLMRVPAEKAMSYTVVTVIASIMMFLLVGAIASRMGSPFGPGASDRGTVTGTVNIPGVGAVDLAKMEAAGKQMEMAAKQMEAGTAVAVAPEMLQTLLPETLGSWTRTGISSSGASAGGFGGSRAEARYRRDNQSFRLEVTDIAAAGALASMAEAMNIQSSRQTDTGYEKTGMVNGRLTTEKWDNGRNSGKFSVMVANRFMIEASGEAPDIDVLKQAVHAIHFDRLEKMTKQS